MKALDAYDLISVIVPVHNQAKSIGALVERYRQSLGKLKTPFELILVPNGCTDESVEACRTLSHKFSDVHVEESQKQGWGAAVRHGLKKASGDLLCYTNSARTTPDDLSLALHYANIHNGVVVKANRRIRENLARRIGSLLYNLECRMFFDLAFWDVNGTPKVFPRSCDGLLNLERDDDLIDLEFNVVCRNQNYPILEYPIFSFRRHEGKSTTRLNSAFRLYWGAFRLWLSRKAPHEIGTPSS